MPAHKQNLLDRFNKFWEPIPIAGCWLWTGNGKRYGKMKIWNNGNPYWESSHRISYRLHKGEIPNNMFVLHTCDVEGCVNPNHLKLGTQSENQQDRYQRSKRFNRGKGGRFTCGS